METEKLWEFGLNRLKPVADCEDCLAVWKRFFGFFPKSFQNFPVADCEDCLAVWKRILVPPHPRMGTRQVADCEDCLAVWKQGPPEWERAF